MSQNAGRRDFFTIIFPLHRVYVSLDPSASVSESKGCSKQIMSVRWKEQWCYQILPLYVYSLVSAVIIYNTFINIYCSLCTKTESSSLVKCSIRVFFYLGYERYNLGSALRPQNMDMYSLRQFHLLRYVCTVKTYEMGGDNWPGRSRKQWIETLALGSVFSIHLSVSNCMYWKVFYSNISHGVNLSETNLSFLH